MCAQPSPPEPELAPETNPVSFVVRFVYDAVPGASPASARAWHGVIRHVQSDAERYFAHWQDAVAFIAQYVDVAQE
jgi:hypothetical protein